jgi:hypothetical protein
MMVSALAAGQEMAFDAASAKPNRDGGRVQITYLPARSGC